MGHFFLSTPEKTRSHSLTIEMCRSVPSSADLPAAPANNRRFWFVMSGCENPMCVCGSNRKLPGLPGLRLRYCVRASPTEPPSACRTASLKLWLRRSVFRDKCPQFIHVGCYPIEGQAVPCRTLCGIRIIDHLRCYAKLHCCPCLLVEPRPSETRLAGVWLTPIDCGVWLHHV